MGQQLRRCYLWCHIDLVVDTQSIKYEMLGNGVLMFKEGNFAGFPMPLTIWSYLMGKEVCLIVSVVWSFIFCYMWCKIQQMVPGARLLLGS